MKKNQIIKNSGPTRRPSNRVYPPRKCKKPDCDVTFTPTSKKHVYCIPQHRIDYNNDRRDIKELPLKILGKKLTYNKEILEKIYNSLAANNQTSFSIQILQYELYHFGMYTDKAVNQETGNQIEWVYNYGLEGKDAVKKTFIIHFRKTTPLQYGTSNQAIDV